MQPWFTTVFGCMRFIATEQFSDAMLDCFVMELVFSEQLLVNVTDDRSGIDSRGGKARAAMGMHVCPLHITYFSVPYEYCVTFIEALEYL